MLTITRPSGRELIEEFTLSFDYKGERGWGFGFDCDKNGNLLAPDNPAAAANMLLCLLDDGTQFEAPYVTDFSREVRVPAEGKCRCGGTVHLSSGHSNRCDNSHCKREYNMSGQELAPRSQWGEEWVNKPEEDYGYY